MGLKLAAAEMLLQQTANMGMSISSNLTATNAMQGKLTHTMSVSGMV
jgi:hypothetical protein